MTRSIPIFALVALMVVGMIVPLLPAQPSAEPIRPHPENARVFLFRGRPTELVGASHLSYGAWSTGDYVRMLDVAQAYGLNVFRVWNTVSRWPDHDRLHPWVRTSVPGAADGGGKFDLDTWNAAYFARLKDLVVKAAERGIVVEIVLLNGYEKVWNLSPLRAHNNVQGVGGGGWGTFLTLTDRALQERQQAVIAKVVSELNGFDNVYFEIMNEPSVFNAPWHNRMIQTVVAAERALPNKHMIAVNGPEHYDALAPKPSIVNAHYAYGDEWTGAFPMLDQMSDREVALAADEMSEVPRYLAPAAGRVEAWEFMVGGGSVYNGLVNGDSYDSPAADAYRRYLRDLREFLARFELVRMRRDTTLVREGVPAGASARAISEPGRQYALYLHHSFPADSNGPGGRKTHYMVQPGNYQATLVLDLPPGSYVATWVLPESGAVVRTDSFDHDGGDKPLTTPSYSIDIALAIRAR